MCARPPAWPPAVNPLVMHYTFVLLSNLYGREVNVWSPATEVSAVTLLLPAALLVCAALSTPAARCLFWPFVEPPIGWLFQPRKEAAPAVTPLTGLIGPAASPLSSQRLWQAPADDLGPECVNQG